VVRRVSPFSSASASRAITGQWHIMREIDQIDFVLFILSDLEEHVIMVR
jgi:hypothetical protein